jgi:hypothetical protein
MPLRTWLGVTSQADREHLAREMLAIATEVYSCFPEEKICFQLRLDGTRPPHGVQP